MKTYKISNLWVLLYLLGPSDLRESPTHLGPLHDVGGDFFCCVVKFTFH